METTLSIKNPDFWFKPIEHFQQNWALIDSTSDNCMVYFIGDKSGLLNKLEFSSSKEAVKALQRNGFHRYSEDKKARNLIIPPRAPFRHKLNSAASIYSTGWCYC